jgi:hypothetical protein
MATKEKIKKKTPPAPEGNNLLWMKNNDTHKDIMKSLNSDGHQFHQGKKQTIPTSRTLNSAMK